MSLKEKNINKLFALGVFIKGAQGLIELVGGTLLLFVTTNSITAFISKVTNEELLEHPRDFISIHLVEFASHLSIGDKIFATVYLIVHGIIKIILIIGLLREKLWAYYTYIFVLCGLIVYEFYKVSINHSLALLAFTLIDVFVVWIIWRESRILTGDRKHSAHLLEKMHID
jgi:uncharacterized membrane protein